jgi:hypothetical protein
VVVFESVVNLSRSSTCSTVDHTPPAHDLDDVEGSDTIDDRLLKFPFHEKKSASLKVASTALVYGRKYVSGSRYLTPGGPSRSIVGGGSSTVTRSSHSTTSWSMDPVISIS